MLLSGGLGIVLIVVTTMISPVLVRPEAPPSEFEARVVAAKYGDLRAYAKAVHNIEIEAYQEAWEEALNSLNRTIIICPPDTYKTTTVRMWCEQQIGRNPNIRILWLQNAGDQAQKQVMTIQRTIDSNNVYRGAFGVEEDTGAQWTKSVLFVRRAYTGPEPTIMGCGLNGPYQGLHFDVIIIDDPTNQEDVRSPTTMELQTSKLRGVIVDRLVEGGRIVGILTRWGETDLVPTFADMGFDLIEMPIAGDYPWGPTLSPKRFTPERVEAIRRDKGDMLFALTFMCSTSATDGNIIKREHIGYWDASTIPNRPLNIYMAVDPAASTKTSADYSAIAVVGTDLRSRKIYVMDVWAKRLEVPDLEFEIARRAKKTSGLRALGLETVGFQLSLVQSLKRKYNLPLREIPYRSRRSTQSWTVALDRDKVGRAAYLDALFASDRLLLPRGLPLVHGVSLETELCLIPYGKHDDRMDALSMACVLADGARLPLNRRPRFLFDRSY